MHFYVFIKSTAKHYECLKIAVAYSYTIKIRYIIILVEALIRSNYFVTEFCMIDSFVPIYCDFYVQLIIAFKFFHLIFLLNINLFLFSMGILFLCINYRLFLLLLFLFSSLLHFFYTYPCNIKKHEMYVLSRVILTLEFPFFVHDYADYLIFKDLFCITI